MIPTINCTKSRNFINIYFTPIKYFLFLLFYKKNTLIYFYQKINPCTKFKIANDYSVNFYSLSNIKGKISTQLMSQTIAWVKRVIFI